MRTNVICPHCGRTIAKTAFAGRLVYTLDGDILLWCTRCKAEIPFRYEKREANPHN